MVGYTRLYAIIPGYTGLYGIILHCIGLYWIIPDSLSVSLDSSSKAADRPRVHMRLPQGDVLGPTIMRAGR